MKNTFSNGTKMNLTTNLVARKLMLTLLAIMMTTLSWAQKLSGEGTEENPYLINNAADWATFTTNVNKSGVNIYADAYYLLTSDLNLGTESEPITTVVGNQRYKQFKGTFDGGFHTIHLIMNRTNDFAGLFGTTDNATIKNLTVDGTITTDHKFAGGIVGYSNNTNNNTTRLINCISRVHIICDNIHKYIDYNGNVVEEGTKPYDCTHGGLVGQNEAGSISFENCIFEGSITDSKEVKTANKCTGFIGWVNNTVYYTNCTMAGTIDVKANDNSLKDSMANFHRKAASAKVVFNGPSYYIVDYTYSGLAQQGTQAPTTAPDNAISKKYIVGKTTYYVPGAVIYGDEVSYYGRDLVESTNFSLTKQHTDTQYVVTFQGLNEYAGTYTETYHAIKMDITPWDEEKQTGWYAISSPDQNIAFSEVENLTSATHNIYRYDEKTRMWQEYRNTANIYSAFENGRGYIYRTLDNGGTITFNGTPNRGDVSYTLSSTSQSDNYAGFNLIGNPYSHSIYKGVAIPSDYLADGYCLLNTDGTWLYKADSEAIPATTAILVQAPNLRSAQTITMKDTKAAPTAKRANNDNIWFSVKNGKYEDVACIEFSEGNGFNKMAHYNEDAPMLYVSYNGQDYAAANVSDDTKVVDLCFKTKETSRYTLSIKANGMFDYLHLIDRVTGEDVDMLIDDEYSFIGSSIDNAIRFIVKFSYNTGNDDVDEVFAYQNGSDLLVNGEGELQVFDVTGRMMMNASVNGEQRINITQGVYILRLLGNDVKTQKIVVR